MYLESGQLMARHTIMKMKLTFLHYILKQDTNSLISRFFYSQLKKPTKCDWCSEVMKLIQDLDLNLTIVEIKEMSRYQFKSILKRSINKVAFIYLTQIQDKKYKGSDIEYGSFLKTQDYLLPNSYLNLEEQKQMMKIRFKMNKIPFNFSHRKQDINCRKGCQEQETN